MKLQVGKLPKNNKGELLIQVDYDQDDDGNCKKSFTKGFAQGALLDVPDELGAAILSKYPKIVTVATKVGKEDFDPGVKVPGKDKIHDGPSKTA